MVHFGLNNRGIFPLRRGGFHLAYKGTALIVMTAGPGAHCKEINSCVTSF